MSAVSFWCEFRAAHRWLVYSKSNDIVKPALSSHLIVVKRSDLLRKCPLQTQSVLYFTASAAFSFSVLRMQPGYWNFRVTINAFPGRFHLNRFDLSRQNLSKAVKYCYQDFNIT